MPMIKRSMVDYDGRPGININLDRIADTLDDISGKLSGGSTGVFVGFVTNNQRMPTTRKDGSELKDEDYVRPEQSSTFPFTTLDGKCTFPTKISKAIYSKPTGTWVVDIGALQDTSETPIVSTLESFSGESVCQNQVNEEVVTELKKTIKQYLVLPINYNLYIGTIAFYVGSTTSEYEQYQYYKCTETGWVKTSIVAAKSIKISNIDDELASKIYRVEVDESNPDVLILKSLNN